jgi:hypothetical protein
MLQKQTLWPLVRKRTIPTERPPFVCEILVPTFAVRGVLHGRRGGTPTAVNLSFIYSQNYWGSGLRPPLGIKKNNIISQQTNKQTNKQTPWPLIRKRTIPTEQPPLVHEI